MELALRLAAVLLALQMRAAPCAAAPIPACPPACSCAPTPGTADRLTVNCSGVGLSSMPRLGSTLRSPEGAVGSRVAAVGTLDLSGNSFAGVDLALLQDLDGLEVLDLGANGIVEVWSSSQAGWQLAPWQRGSTGGGQLLKNLKVLLLNNNRLQYIPEVLRELRSLERLSLAGNELFSVPSDALHTLSHLRHLELQGNSISLVECGAFRGLGALTELNLGENSLSTLNLDSLVDLEDAVSRGGLSVDLRGNPWSCDCRPSALLSWALQSAARSRLLEGVTCGGHPTGQSLLAAEEECGRPGASVIAEEGTTAVLPCGPEAGAEVLYWRTPLGPVVDGEQRGHAARPHVGERGALVVPRAGAEHEGRYECVRRGAGGREVAGVRLFLAGGAGERRGPAARSAAPAPRAAVCPVSQQQFALAVSLAVIVTFFGAFALGALARPYVAPLFSCCSQKLGKRRTTDRGAAGRDNPAFSDDVVQERLPGDGRKDAGRKKGPWMFGRKRKDINEHKVSFHVEPPGAVFRRDGEAKVSLDSSSSNSSPGHYRNTHLPGMGVSSGGRRDIDSTDSARGSSLTTYENVQLNAPGHAKPQRPTQNSDSDTSSSDDAFANVSVQPPSAYAPPARGVAQTGHLGHVSGGTGASLGGHQGATAHVISPKRLAPLPPQNVLQNKSAASQLPTKQNSGVIVGAGSVAVVGKPTEVGALNRWPDVEMSDAQLRDDRQHGAIPKKPPRRDHSDATSDSDSDEGQNVVPGPARGGKTHADDATALEEISLSSNYVVHIDGVDTGETTCDVDIDSAVAHGSHQRNVGQAGGQDASRAQAGLQTTQSVDRSSSSGDDSSNSGDGAGLVLPGAKGTAEVPRYAPHGGFVDGHFPPNPKVAPHNRLGQQASDAGAASEKTPSRQSTFSKLKAAMNFKAILPKVNKERGKNKSKAEARKKGVQSGSSSDSSTQDEDHVKRKDVANSALSRPLPPTVQMTTGKVNADNRMQSTDSSLNASEQRGLHGVKGQLAKRDSQSTSDSGESDDDRRESLPGDGTEEGAMVSVHAKWPTTQSLHRAGRGEDSDEDAAPGVRGTAPVNDGRGAGSLPVTSNRGQEPQKHDSSHSVSSDDRPAASSQQLAASRVPERQIHDNSHSDSSDDNRPAGSLRDAATRGRDRQRRKGFSSDSSDDRRATSSVQAARPRGRERQRRDDSQSDSSDDERRPPRGYTGPLRGEAEGSGHREDDRHVPSQQLRSDLIASTLAAWPRQRSDVPGSHGLPRVSNTSSEDESVERPAPQPQHRATLIPTADRNISPTSYLHTQWSYSTASTGTAQPHGTAQTENALGLGGALSSALLTALKPGEKGVVFSSSSLLSRARGTDESSSSSSSGDEQPTRGGRGAKPDLLSSEPPPLPDAPPPGDDLDDAQGFEIVNLPKLSVTRGLPGTESDGSFEEFIDRQPTPAAGGGSFSDTDSDDPRRGSRARTLGAAAAARREQNR